MKPEQAIGTILDDFLRRSPRPLLDAAIFWDGATWTFTRGEAPTGGPPVFEIGSIGKTFTTTLLAQLVRDGRLGLYDRVADHCPAYPWAGAVMLRDLASHTAGLPANPVDWWTLRRRGRQVAEAFVPEDLDRFLRTLAKVRPPGRFRYSNVGVALLGRILAQRMACTYEEAVIRSICAPLGLHDIRVDWRAFPEERLARGHDAKGRPLPPFTWPGLEAAGVWRSTAADLLRFLCAQTGLAGSEWAELARSTTTPVARVSSDTRIGLGWMLSDLPGIGPVAWHGGGTFGQESVAGWALEQPLAVVILTNRMPSLWGHLRGPRLEALPARIAATLMA